jgi:hypothetical protein
MNIIPKHNITAARALDLINSNEPIKDVFISGKLSLSGLDNFNKSIILENCIVEYIEGISSQFLKKLEFRNSNFKLCDFTFTYFLGGLDLDCCVFENYLDFQAGGHNKSNSLFSITNCTFKGFVNFFDCWYESQVVIQSNHFIKGTNLLGKDRETGIKTRFDILPTVENNVGKLDVGDEGDIESKSVFLLWTE